MEDLRKNQIDLLPYMFKARQIIRHLGKVLIFIPMKATLGIDAASYSNGTAYADLDNDGVLDLVINNAGSAGLIIEITRRKKMENTSLSIDFKGKLVEPFGIGAKGFLSFLAKKLLASIRFGNSRFPVGSTASVGFWFG